MGGKKKKLRQKGVCVRGVYHYYYYHHLSYTRTGRAAVVAYDGVGVIQVTVRSCTAAARAPQIIALKQQLRAQTHARRTAGVIIINGSGYRI